jgi:hypothetical protein
LTDEQIEKNKNNGWTKKNYKRKRS